MVVGILVHYELAWCLELARWLENQVNINKRGGWNCHDGQKIRNNYTLWSR